MAFWVCAGITLISSMVSAGYAVANLRTTHLRSRGVAEYALSRSIALVVVSIIAVFVANTGFLVAVATCMTLVQGMDSVVGARSGDRFKTVGPAMTASANAAALIWMLLAQG